MSELIIREIIQNIGKSSQIIIDNFDKLIQSNENIYSVINAIPNSKIVIYTFITLSIILFITKYDIRLNLILALMISLSLAVLANQVLASDKVINDVIFMVHDDVYEKKFEIYNVFDFRELGPIQSFVVVTTGMAGELTIELSTDLEMESGEIMEFAIIGAGFSINGGLITVIEKKTTPNSIERVVPINSVFGFVTVGVIIVKKTDGVETPVPFTIELSLEELEEEEEL